MQTPIERLVSAGVHELAGMSADDLAALSPSGAAPHGAVLAVHPRLVGATRLTALMRRDGKPGFVVVDMTDLDDFAPIDGFDIPDAALYWVHDVDRGDDLANWSPDEALPAIQRTGRSSLTIS